MIRTTSFVFHVQCVEDPLPPAHRFLRQFEIDMPRGWRFKKPDTPLAKIARRIHAATLVAVPHALHSDPTKERK